MTLEHLGLVSQIAGALGVIVSLIFVGFQIKQNTNAIQRSEHNSTMAQWTVIRQAIATNRDVAELMTTGLQGQHAVDAADQLRIDQMLAEYAWAAFHIWDRTERVVFPKGTFELTGGALLAVVLGTPGGAEWWRRTKHSGFIPQFAADVDTLLKRSPATKQEPESAHVASPGHGP
jgi:hypothetical protein